MIVIEMKHVGDILLKSIKKSIRDYSKKPLPLAWSVVLSIILNIVALLATTGALLLIYYILSLVNLGGELVLVGGIVILLFIIYLSMMNGLKGALINTLKTSSRNGEVHPTYFFEYAVDRGESFFGLTVLKYIIFAIPIIPLFLIYNYILIPMNIPYISILFGVIVFGIIGILEIPFCYAYISMATKERGIFNSIKYSMRLLRKKHVEAIALYIIYGFVWLTLYIPLINLIAITITYPIMYNAMISFYDKYGR